MATRAESVMAIVSAEMVTRGVDVSHSWGKQKNERHDRQYPRVTWVEADDDETIEDAGQTSYSDSETGDDDERTAIYERSVGLTVTVIGKTPESTEAVLDALLASARHRLTIAAFSPTKIKKRGERPSTEHARILECRVTLPVFDETRPLGTIKSVDIVPQVSNALGLSPQAVDGAPED